MTRLLPLLFLLTACEQPSDRELVVTHVVVRSESDTIQEWSRIVRLPIIQQECQ